MRLGVPCWLVLGDSDRTGRMGTGLVGEAGDGQSSDRLSSHGWLLIFLCYDAGTRSGSKQKQLHINININININMKGMDRS